MQPVCNLGNATKTVRLFETEKEEGAGEEDEATEEKTPYHSTLKTPHLLAGCKHAQRQSACLPSGAPTLMPAAKRLVQPCLLPPASRLPPRTLQTLSSSLHPASLAARVRPAPAASSAAFFCGLPLPQPLPSSSSRQPLRTQATERKPSSDAGRGAARRPPRNASERHARHACWRWSRHAPRLRAWATSPRADRT